MTESLSEASRARLGEADRVFTSDLSIAEFALLDTMEFEPIDLVMGTSVYHIGWQPQRRQASQELTVLSTAMYTARENAMARMQAEADALQADGIVGVRLNWRRHGISAEHIEFVAIGTAVREKARTNQYKRPDGRAFSSHLSGQDFYTLLSVGWAPVAFVLGTCVYHVAAQGFMQTLSQIGQNVEMPQWTQAYFDAREIAMSRMQAEAERDTAQGVVGVTLETSEFVWGAHTMEFYAAGTAVRKVGEARFPAPSQVLPLR